MKKIIIILAVMTSMLTYVLSSCYKNREDILTLPKVSFTADVVPIFVQGGCGCHNNGVAKNAVQFSHADTIFYSTILSRTDTISDWVNGGTHPGGGSIDFSPGQSVIIKKWIDEGATDDRGGCTVTGAITYTDDIVPIYNTTCKGPNCHGGIAVSLDYDKLVQEKNTLINMVNSGGATGHPGGPLNLGACEAKTIEEWINQGQPQ